jgi:hypothetical protein
MDRASKTMMIILPSNQYVAELVESSKKQALDFPPLFVMPVRQAVHSLWSPAVLNNQLDPVARAWRNQLPGVPGSP